MQTPGQSLVLRNKSKPLYSFSNFSGFRADAKPSEVAASRNDSRRRNNEVFPVCWSGLVWETWRCNEEVLLIVGNNCVFVKRVWVDGRVCRGSLTTGFVCPASRSRTKRKLSPPWDVTRLRWLRSSVSATFSAVALGLPTRFPLPLKHAGRGKRPVYFRTAIIQDGANVCRGLQGGRFRWPADLARSDWHSWISPLPPLLPLPLSLLSQWFGLCQRPV